MNPELNSQTIEQVAYRTIDLMNAQAVKQFSLPPNTHIGAGAIACIGDLLTDWQARHVFIVIDEVVERLGLAAPMFRSLDHAQLRYTLFRQPVGEPESDVVERGARECVQSQGDALIAMGGGSAIDSAKAIAVLAANPSLNTHDLLNPANITQRRMPMVAIPTTAGTGSEATNVTVITDSRSQHKQVIAHPDMIPDIALIDACLMIQLPPAFTAATGVDALTHAIEAYVSTANCDFTDPLALHAIEMIQADLVGSYNGDMEKRDAMHNAQCLAGMAFSNALLGIVHSMAHGLSALYDTPHGVACAIILPTGLEYNKTVAGERYRAVGKAMGVTGIDEMNDVEAADATIAAVKKLSADVGIPADLKGILKEEDVQFLAESAFADACCPGNPRDTSVEEIKELYRSLM